MERIVKNETVAVQKQELGTALLFVIFPHKGDGPVPEVLHCTGPTRKEEDGKKYGQMERIAKNETVAVQKQELGTAFSPKTIWTRLRSPSKPKAKRKEEVFSSAARCGMMRKPRSAVFICRSANYTFRFT